MHVEQTRLSNGLLVITAASPYLESAACGAFINAGARQETIANNGVAHFLEHLMFKGTTSRSAYEIVKQIEILGSDINAYTSTGMTAYHSTGLAINIAESIDIIGDALTDPLFAADDIGTESGVIVQEIRRSEDNPSSVMFDLLQKISYPDQQLGRPILGSLDFVTSATAADFRSFMAQHYTADNIIVVVAGGVDHDQIVQRVERAFNIAALPLSANRGTIIPAVYGGGLQIDRSRDFKQASVGIAFESVKLLDDRLYHHLLLAGAFGGGMSSPLFTEIREKRGLVYSTGCFADIDIDYGRIIISGGMTAENVEEFVSVAAQEFRKMTETVKEADLMRAKNAQLTALATLCEKPYSSMLFLARSYWQRGHIRDAAEIRAAIEAVTLDDVRMAAEAVLTTAPTIAMVGPIPDADYAGLIQTAIA